MAEKLRVLDTPCPERASLKHHERRVPPTPVECSMVCVGWKQAGHVDS